MTPKALQFWPVLLTVLCPSTVAAQKPEFSLKWMLEGSGGMSVRPGDGTSPSLGVTTAMHVGRTLGPRMSWRAGLEYETWELGDPNQNPFSFGVSFGVLATASAHDRGLYITGRVGYYVHPWGPLNGTPGGYVGVGAAAPIGPGALTFETGVQGYAFIAAPGHDDISPSNPGTYAPWSVPIRVGYRGPM